MSTYRQKLSSPVVYSQYAVGKNSGSLFIMLPALAKGDYETGIILAGYGALTGCEGHRIEAKAYLFERLPVGTILEIVT